MTLVLVIENAQIHLSDPVDGDVAVLSQEETDLQAPITRDVQIRSAGEREFTGQRIAERLQVPKEGARTNQLLERLQD